MWLFHGYFFKVWPSINIPLVIWACSVQPFWCLLNKNKQKDKPNLWINSHQKKRLTGKLNITFSFFIYISISNLHSTKAQTQVYKIDTIKFYLKFDILCTLLKRLFMGWRGGEVNEGGNPSPSFLLRFNTPV